MTLARHRTSGIVRAVISVADAERALRFYRDVLGLPTEPRGPGIVTLALPNGAEVLLHQRPATPSLAGIAVTFGVDDVDAVTAAATDAGCAVLHLPRDEPCGERQSVVTDSDGHVVCLAQVVGPPTSDGHAAHDAAASPERAFGWWDISLLPTATRERTAGSRTTSAQCSSDT